MGALDASLQASGKASNAVEVGDEVTVVFTNPPKNAQSVKVQIIEAAAPGDARKSDQLLATFRGAIVDKQFLLEGNSGDPLDTNPQPNPELANLKLSSAPPRLSVKLNVNGRATPIPLPDTEEEGGQYEIKLKVTGQVDGKSETFEGQALLVVRIKVDVMIVPEMTGVVRTAQNAHEHEILRQNAAFGKQWRDHSPAQRALVTLQVGGTREQLKAAVASAAARATGGDVLLCVGHGGAGGFRGLNLTVFDTVPDLTSGISNHPHAITSDVVGLEDRATHVGRGQWKSKASIPASDEQRIIDALGAKFELLEDLGAELKKNGVARFFIMACNFARDTAFGDRLAKIMKVRVAGYARLLAIGGATFTNPSASLEQAWLSVDPLANPQDRPPSADRNHSSFHEVPAAERVFNP